MRKSARADRQGRRRSVGARNVLRGIRWQRAGEKQHAKMIRNSSSRQSVREAVHLPAVRWRGRQAVRRVFRAAERV